MISFFKKRVKENVYLYMLFHFYIRQHIWSPIVRKIPDSEVKLPKKGDVLYLGGYPRSGNTSLVKTIKYVFPDIGLNSNHLHSVAGIKISLKANVPTYVLLRAPEESISSYYIMKKFYRKKGIKPIDTKLCKLLIMEYINYYRFVRSMIRNIRIVPFETVINPVSFLEELNRIHDQGLLPVKIGQLYKEVERIHLAGQVNKPKERSSTPNEERKHYKKLVKEDLQKLNEFREAKKIYEVLIKRHKLFLRN